MNKTMGIYNDETLIAINDRSGRRSLQERRCAMGDAKVFRGEGKAELSEETTFIPVLIAEGVDIEKPEINLLVARDLLHRRGVGGVLSTSDLQPAIAKRQVIPGMKRDRAFRPDDDRTSRKRWEIIGFVGK